MAEEPITIFMGTTTFRKDGTPVLGTMGASARRVVLIEAGEWKRLSAAHPSLQTQQFRVGELDG